jgi:hypothetical protein
MSCKGSELIAAKHNHVLAFDNLSTIKPMMADAFCRIATGGGFGSIDHFRVFAAVRCDWHRCPHQLDSSSHPKKIHAVIPPPNPPRWEDRDAHCITPELV